MALAERRTAAAGGAQATVSTAAGVWTELTTAMVNAGWTVFADLSGAGNWPNWIASTVLPPVSQNYSFGDRVTNAGNRYMCIVGGTAGTGAGPTATSVQTEGTVTWEFVSASTANDVYYTSTGESGTDKLYCRVTQYSTFVNVTLYQYVSGTSFMGFNRVNLARTSGMSANQKAQQFNYSGATTINFAIIADKDSVCAVTVDQTNAKRVIMFGNMRRWVDVNPNTFVSNGAVTAGLNKTFTFSSGNPIAAGYKLGDPIMIVSQETSTASNMVIPLHSSKITALTTNSITVKEVKESVAAGALIGQDPMPYFYLYNQATSGNPGTTGNPICVHNIHDENVTNLWSSAKATAEAGYLTDNAPIPVRDSSFAELDPNNRTGYFQLISQLVKFSNIDVGQHRGFIPKFYHWHTAANNQWVIAKEIRTSPTKDWIFVRDTPPSTGPAWIFGPFNATTATVNFQTFDLVNDWGYRECDLFPERPHTVDRLLSGAVNAGPIEPLNKDRRLRVDEHTEDTYDMMRWVNLQESGTPWVSSHGYSKWFQANLLTVEPYPFDSATSTQGGTSNGFNSGFN